MDKQHKEYLQGELLKMMELNTIIINRVTVLEKAMLHIVNSLSETKQKELRRKIKKS